MKRKRKKKQHLFKIEIFYNIINVFTVTFHQFNASLMNKSINFFQKIIITYTQPKFFNLLTNSRNIKEFYLTVAWYCVNRLP